MIAADNRLMVEFIDFAYKIHSKSWCDSGEEHTKNWCEGVCKPAKFIRPIKKVFYQNISVEEKKKNFIVQSLMNKSIFGHLFIGFFW